MPRKRQTPVPPNTAITPAPSEAQNIQAPEAPAPVAPNVTPVVAEVAASSIGPRRTVMPNGTIREDY